MLRPAFGRSVPWHSTQYFVKVCCGVAVAEATPAPEATGAGAGAGPWDCAAIAVTTAQIRSAHAPTCLMQTLSTKDLEILGDLRAAA